MTTARKRTNGARERYLEKWRRALKSPTRAAGLAVPLETLFGGKDQIDYLRPLAAVEEGSDEHGAAVAEHRGLMLEAHEAMLDAEEDVRRYRDRRAVEMAAQALLGVKPARIAADCKVGPMVVARAIGTSARVGEG